MVIFVLCRCDSSSTCMPAKECYHHDEQSKDPKSSSDTTLTEEVNNTLMQYHLLLQHDYSGDSLGLKLTVLLRLISFDYIDDKGESVYINHSSTRCIPLDHTSCSKRSYSTTNSDSKRCFFADISDTEIIMADSAGMIQFSTGTNDAKVGSSTTNSDRKRRFSIDSTDGREKSSTIFSGRKMGSHTDISDENSGPDPRTLDRITHSRTHTSDWQKHFYIDTSNGNRKFPTINSDHKRRLSTGTIDGRNERLTSNSDRRLSTGTIDGRNEHLTPNSDHKSWLSTGTIDGRNKRLIINSGTPNGKSKSSGETFCNGTRSSTDTFDRKSGTPTDTSDGKRCFSTDQQRAEETASTSRSHAHVEHIVTEGRRRSMHFHPKNMHASMPTQTEGERTAIHKHPDGSKGSMPSPSAGTNGSIPVMKDAFKLSNMILTALPFIKTHLRVLILLVLISLVACEDINLDCTRGVSLTSPNYPDNYNNNANEQWYVTAPSYHRLLITFIDFIVEEGDDFLRLYDKVHALHIGRYTGGTKQFPPFLTLENWLEINFISTPRGTLKGFNISISCYVQSNTTVARIAGGSLPGEGFLELRTQSQEWMRVCEDNIPRQVAEVVCRELGYPGVKEISYANNEVRSLVLKAPSCGDDTYRLEDCVPTSEICTSSNVVKIDCHEPGYEGCYNSESLPQPNGSNFTSFSECLSSCKVTTAQHLAVVNKDMCSCFTANELNLSSLIPTDDRTCIQQDVNSFVFNADVGFCNQTDDVINGFWDSNITWFGSIIHLTCNTGYSLNGIETLQCVPGVSPYYPSWNDLMPTCEKDEDSTPFTSSTRHPPSDFEPSSGAAVKFSVSPIIIIILTVMIFITIAVIVSLWGSRRRKIKRYRGDTFRASSGQTQQDNAGSTLTANQIPIPDSLTTDINLTHVRELNSDTLQPELQQTSHISLSLFPSLQHTAHQHAENHYDISNNDSHPYNYAIGSGVSTFTSNNMNHPTQEDLNIDTNRNTYEEADVPTGQTNSDQSREMMSMLHRPLPHRPISVGVHEGPSLPPRERQGIPPFTRSTTLTQNTSSNNSHIGPRSLDNNAITNEDQQGSSAIFNSHIIYHDDSLYQEKDQIPRIGQSTQQVADVYPCTGATFRASSNHGYYSADDLEHDKSYNGGAIPLSLQLSKPDPFYHCLEDEHQQMGRDGDELLQSESRHSCQSDVMVDNPLYNPLPL